MLLALPLEGLPEMRRSLLYASLRNLAMMIFSVGFSYLLPFWLQRVVLGACGSNLGSSSAIHRGVRIFSGPTNLDIGRNSTINANAVLDNRALIAVGNNVSISQGVKIYTGGHDIHSKFFEYRARPVTIGDFAAIFSYSIILPGVSIGKGAVILPGSVVAKSVPAFEIWGGNPAAKVGERRHDLEYEINHRAWWSL